MYDQVLASIPSPARGVWHLGPLPVRGYALCIILGVIVSVWIGDRRWIQRGGRPGTVGDIAVWAVPFGLVGGRLYHVLTDPELYFGEGKSPITALYVWRGGLGIWGAIALGGVGAYIGCRRRGINFPSFADALAPAIVVAQAIGRWGNWFNQELYGKPTDLPWGLKIDPAHREDFPDDTTFQPIFLYEFLWDLGVAGVVIWADRKYRLGHGRAFALYVMAYTAGRCWIEMLRVDTVNHIFGLRLNVWTSIIVFILATIYFVVVGRLRTGREDPSIVEPGYSDVDVADADADAESDLETTGDGDGDDGGDDGGDDEPDPEAEVVQTTPSGAGAESGPGDDPSDLGEPER